MPTHTFLITGASVGIGRATAERLAAAGHTVIGLSRREAPGFPGIYRQVDLADRNATGQALAELVAEHEIDGLVNNVGLVRPAPLAEITLGAKKSADGMQALLWWKQGQIDKIVEYCKKDVQITRDLYLYGKTHGYLLFRNKAMQHVRLPVCW